MEDNLVSCLIANTVYLMTFLATCSKFYLGSVQRIEEKICNGFKTDDQTLKIPVASLVALGSLFGHLILSIPIMIEQRKDSYINRVIPLNQNNNANLGNKGVRVIIVLLLVLGTIVNHLLQK